MNIFKYFNNLKDSNILFYLMPTLDFTNQTDQFLSLDKDDEILTLL